MLELTLHNRKWRHVQDWTGWGWSSTAMFCRHGSKCWWIYGATENILTFQKRCSFARKNHGAPFCFTFTALLNIIPLAIKLSDINDIRRSQNAAAKQGSDAPFFGNYKVEKLRQHKRSLFSCSTFKISTVFKWQPTRMKFSESTVSPIFSLHGKLNLLQWKLFYLMTPPFAKNRQRRWQMDEIWNKSWKILTGVGGGGPKNFGDRSCLGATLSTTNQQNTVY